MNVNLIDGSHLLIFIRKFVAVLLAESGRLRNIETIASRYRELAMAHKGEMKAVVTTVIVSDHLHSFSNHCHFFLSSRYSQYWFCYEYSMVDTISTLRGFYLSVILIIKVPGGCKKPPLLRLIPKNH